MAVSGLAGVAGQKLSAAAKPVIVEAQRALASSPAATSRAALLAASGTVSSPTAAGVTNAVVEGAAAALGSAVASVEAPQPDLLKRKNNDE